MFVAITITHSEQAAWQRRATQLLGRLLTTFPTLPVIAWTVGPAGATLVGRCAYPNDPAARRTAFATCAVLGARPRPDHTSGDVTHLHAFGEIDGVRITLMAEIFNAHIDGEEVCHGAR
jgi:hypothetical protein